MSTRQTRRVPVDDSGAPHATADPTPNGDYLSHRQILVVIWVLTAFTQAMDDLFAVAVPFLAVGLVIALLMREKPLGGREQAAPAAPEARTELAGVAR